VPLQTVCVRHVPAAYADGAGSDADALDAHTRAWVEALNATGLAFVTPALHEGRWMVRVSIGAEATERSDVERLWQLMRTTASVSV
jgi:aromatic-L-amino-acid decarboxylase